jgi:hypothetical protein
MPIAIVLAALIVALGGLAAALIATGTLGGKSKKPAAVSGSGAGKVAATPGVALEPYTAPTYTARLPKGWSIKEDYADKNGFWRTKRSHGSMSILIDVTPGWHRDPKNDSAVVQARNYRPGYRLLRWRWTGFNGMRAFDWGFAQEGTYRDDLLFTTGGNGYGVLGEGPPARYRETVAITRAVAESLRPR